MKLLAEKTEQIPLNIRKGDTVTMVYEDPYGLKQTILKQEVDYPMKINYYAVYLLDSGEFGLKCGIAGVFGEKDII